MRTSCWPPSRTARTSYGPSRGKPSSAAAVPDGAHSHEPQRRRRRPGRAGPRCRCGCRTRSASRRSLRAGPAQLDRRVALAGDDMSVGDDDVRRGDPAGALDAEPARGRRVTRTTLSAARPRRGRRGRSSGSGGLTSAGGPVIAPSGSKRASALRIVLDGGRMSFSPRRICERWTSRRSASAPGVCNSTAPTIHATPRASVTLSRNPSAPSTIPSPGTGSARAQRASDTLEPHRSGEPQEQRPEQAEHRRVGRRTAAVEQQRREARPQERPEDEAREREHADDEPASVAEHAHGGGESDDDPIGGRHGS